MKLTNNKVFQSTTVLHDEGVVVAFLPEINLRPGAVWPERECGCRCYEQRSAESDTSLALILSEVGKSITPLENHGNPRTVGLDVPSSQGQLLVLDVYPRHEGAAEGERLSFWQLRTERYVGLEKATSLHRCTCSWSWGDFNVYFGFLSLLSLANVRYEGSVERRIHGMHTSEAGLGVIFRSQVDCPTHTSGTIICSAVTSSSFGIRVSALRG